MRALQVGDKVSEHALAVPELRRREPHRNKRRRARRRASFRVIA
jgi:hypothetical protein